MGTGHGVSSTFDGARVKSFSERKSELSGPLDCASRLEGRSGFRVEDCSSVRTSSSSSSAVGCGEFDRERNGSLAADFEMSALAAFSNCLCHGSADSKTLAGT